MDKSEKYIEMCREAWKYLQREIELDDVVAYRYAYDGYISEEVDCFFHIAEKWEIKEDYKDTYIFIVWKQDQLQGMLDKWTLLGKIRGLLDFCEPEFMCPDEPACKEDEELGRYRRKTFSSMEQFWLAFAMREKFSKEWRDGKWIKIP